MQRGEGAGSKAGTDRLNPAEPTGIEAKNTYILVIILFFFVFAFVCFFVIIFLIQPKVQSRVQPKKWCSPHSGMGLSPLIN